MNITAIYPGTFDPVTLGHADLVSRASRLFDNVIVGIASNEDKRTLFTVAERLSLAKASLAAHDNVVVCSFDGLLINFAREKMRAY